MQKSVLLREQAIPASRNGPDEGHHSGRAGEASTMHSGQMSGDFPVIHAGSWPADFSLRREDMYGEWER